MGVRNSLPNLFAHPPIDELYMIFFGIFSLILTLMLYMFSPSPLIDPFSAFPRPLIAFSPRSLLVVSLSGSTLQTTNDK